MGQLLTWMARASVRERICRRPSCTLPKSMRTAWYLGGRVTICGWRMYFAGRCLDLSGLLQQSRWHAVTQTSCCTFHVFGCGHHLMCAVAAAHCAASHLGV